MREKKRTNRKIRTSKIWPFDYENETAELINEVRFTLNHEVYEIFRLLHKRMNAIENKYTRYSEYKPVSKIVKKEVFEFMRLSEGGLPKP